MAGVSDGIPVAGRGCGNCTLCCKILAIEEIGKAEGRWCPDCAIGKGCGIYAHRPAACRTFQCGWMIDPNLDEAWRPSVSRLMLVAPAGENRLAVHVDPARPDAWKREPYLGRLQEWASSAARARGQVVIYVGRRATVLLPDRAVDIGPVGDDEVIVTAGRPTHAGIRLDAFKARRDDPRLAGVASQT